MKAFCLASVLSMFFGTACLADQPIAVSGCAVKGVEAGCIILETVTGPSYVISTAKPTPTLGRYGQIKGTLKSDVMSFCMQGAVIDPAEWTETGKSCPLAK